MTDSSAKQYALSNLRSRVTTIIHQSGLVKTLLEGGWKLTEWRIGHEDPRNPALANIPILVLFSQECDSGAYMGTSATVFVDKI